MLLKKDRGAVNGKRNKLNTQPEATHQSHTSEVFGKCCDRSLSSGSPLHIHFSVNKNRMLKGILLCEREKK